jgi:hypothetical protein
MQTTDFHLTKRHLEASAFPHKQITLSEILHVGENICEVQGVPMQFSDQALRQLADLVGIPRHQEQYVKNASGDNGLRNFRNYMSVASGISQKQKMVLVADPHTREVTKVCPIKVDYISLSSFLEFIELLLSHLPYEVDKMLSSCNVFDGLSIMLRPLHPNIQTLAPGEEFIQNGIFLRWNVGRVEAGSYFVRLICQNGAVSTKLQKRLTVNSLDSREVMYLLNELKRGDILSYNFNSYKAMVYSALNSYASLREVEYAYKILMAQGVEDTLARRLFNYDLYVEECKLRTLDIQKYGNNIKTDKKVWDVYNVMTHFANHNTLWDPEDSRRFLLITGAGALLERPRDIQEYVEIGR